LSLAQNPALTLVVVLTVAAVELQSDAAVRSVPALVAAALPLALAADAALAVSGAAVGTALDGAVLPVPAGDAQTGAVLALAVLVAAGVAQPRVAILASPLRVTGTGVALAATMLAAVQVAQLLGTVVAAPLGLAGTRLGVQVEGAVAGAVGQALQRVLIHGGAVRSLPALLADAGAVGAESVARAVRMRTVHWWGEESRKLVGVKHKGSS